MLNIDSNRNDTIPVRIRTRRTLLGSGEFEVVSSVTCARRAKEVSLEGCLACEHCQALVSTRAGRAAHVFCHDPVAAGADVVHPPKLLTARDRGGPRQSAADYVPISAIMSADVTCVRADVSAEALASLLLERGISGAPVVDAAGAPIGVVSRADLLRERHEDDGLLELERCETTAADEAALLGTGFHESRIARRTVADIMLGMTFALPEDASLSQAAALMAYESIHRVPVTCAEGKVVGIVSTLDILRWLAEQDGYLVRR